MALNVSKETQMVFFKKVLAEYPVVLEEVQKMIVEKGVEFSVEFYTVKAKIAGSYHTCTLTVNSSSLMKDNVETFIKTQNCIALVEWIGKLYVALWHKTPPFSLPSAAMKDEAPAPPPVAKPHYVVLKNKGTNVIETIKALRATFHCSLVTAKAFTDNTPCLLTATVNSSVAAHIVQKMTAVATIETGVVHGEDQPIPHGAAHPSVFGQVPFTAEDVMGGAKIADESAPVPTKPVQKVADPSGKAIPLKDATAIKQKVFGTSDGSYYHTVAVGKQVNVACRISGPGVSKSVSIRVEFPKSKSMAIVSQLTANGIEMKEKYGSMHFNTGEVPVARVIGAFLMGLEIPFESQVLQASDLVIGG